MLKTNRVSTVIARSLVLVILSIHCCSAETIEQIQQQLLQPEVLQGQFQQKKQLQGFSKGINSQGRFILAKHAGIYWRTELPLVNTLVITSNQLRQTNASGEHQGLTTTQQPALAQVNKLIFALLSGDLQQLTQQFNCQATHADAGWQLELTPKEIAIKQVLSHVKIRGYQHINDINIIDANGDNTLIEFSNLHPSNELTPSEAAHFSE